MVRSERPRSCVSLGSSATAAGAMTKTAGKLRGAANENGDIELRASYLLFQNSNATPISLSGFTTDIDSK